MSGMMTKNVCFAKLVDVYNEIQQLEKQLTALHQVNTHGKSPRELVELDLADDSCQEKLRCARATYEDLKTYYHAAAI